MSARIVSIDKRRAVRHLYWKGDHRRFVTVCPDGSVILDGRVMTLAEATGELLRVTGMPPSFFWEQ